VDYSGACVTPAGMARNVIAFLCLLLVASAVPDGGGLDDASLATRTLLSAALFDGRPVAPLTDGRLLFRVRRVYKGWHGHVDRDRRVTRLTGPDVRRLIYISCRSADLAGETSPSDGCQLSSAVVGQRYLVFAQLFHVVVVSIADRLGRPPTSTSVGVYLTSGPLVPVTVRSRRIAVLYSDLSFG